MPDPADPHQPHDEVLARAWKPGERPERDALLEREWLVTNGLGGYASGTVSGAATRRYHGLLISAQPAPLGRIMMVNHLWEFVRLPDYNTVPFGGEEKVGGQLLIHGTDHLTSFHLDSGLPVWRYNVHGFLLEKRLFFAYRHNTVYLRYKLLEGSAPIRLKIRPSIHFRGHDDFVSTNPGGPYTFTALDNRYELSAPGPYPALRMTVAGGNPSFTVKPEYAADLIYRVEEQRGYEYHGGLHTPGQFRVDVEPGKDVTFVFSTESWDSVLAQSADDALGAELDRRRRLVEQAAPKAQKGFASELVLAADQFIFTPAARTADAARARAQGDEARSVIAGYHWFTDWGRDTMISLEGLTLTTGRHTDAGYILRTFAQHVKYGLIPNLFPEKGSEGLYHTADATLWYFHALKRYVDHTGDRATLKQLMPKLKECVDAHLAGTKYGIGVNPADGLVRQGQEGYQLTWMDAKVGDWVVTPRRGKAVEINALWYNALKHFETWTREEEGDAAAAPLAAHAEKCRASFNKRFWNEKTNCLFDVLDGPDGTNDPAIRPNQTFAISLDHPVLDQDKWPAVMTVVKEKLLTPVGLRSLAPGHPDYKPQYFGDLKTRDAAYHQGTVWGWLIGPFVDAFVKTYPDDSAGITKVLDGFRNHMGEACVGSISEIFDAEPPYTPRGCIAQAWSVAEVLRCLAKTAP